MRSCLLHSDLPGNGSAATRERNVGLFRSQRPPPPMANRGARNAPHTASDAMSVFDHKEERGRPIGRRQIERQRESHEWWKEVGWCEAPQSNALRMPLAHSMPVDRPPWFANQDKGTGERETGTGDVGGWAKRLDHDDASSAVVRLAE